MVFIPGKKRYIAIMRQISLKWHIFLFYLLLGFIPMMVISYFAVVSYSRSINTLTDDYLTKLVQRIAGADRQCDLFVIRFRGPDHRFVGKDERFVNEFDRVDFRTGARRHAGGLDCRLLTGRLVDDGKQPEAEQGNAESDDKPLKGFGFFRRRRRRRFVIVK